MIPNKAIQLILDSEGIDQPSVWPGGSSGITIGVGYDLGYEDSFRDDWTGVLEPQDLDALGKSVGMRGMAAESSSHQFKGIKITQSQAEKVFETKTLPKYEKQTISAFPGVENLPSLVLGALVSLVYNRGTSMDGERRAEMRNIREAVKKGDLKEIAKQLRLMKRLWQGKGLDGLLKRREAEAELVEESIQNE